MVYMYAIVAAAGIHGETIEEEVTTEEGTTKTTLRTPDTMVRGDELALSLTSCWIYKFCGVISLRLSNN